MIKAIRNLCLAALIGFAPSVALAIPLGSMPVMATAQVSCASTATSVAVQYSNRSSISLANTSATVAVYYGKDASVTTSTGALLPAGGSITFFYTGAIYCIVASGTVTITKTDIFQ